MKIREIQELKNKAPAELQALLTDSERELRTLRFDLNAGKTKAIHTIRELRKKIARILTFMSAANGKNSKK